MIHFATLEQLKRILCLEELAAIYFDEKENKNLISTCSGKVTIKFNSKFVSGYLMGTTVQDQWIVRLINNKEILADKVYYNHVLNAYEYNSTDVRDDEYRIIKYDPVRLVISTGLNSSKVLLNRVCFNSSNVILENHCT